jgi:N-formylmethionyl-tRNA deformylase
MTIEDNEKYLRQISAEVDFNDKSYLDDIKKLEEYCKVKELFAVAAVQIGIPKRLIYLRNINLDKIDDEAWDEAKVLINPTIIKRVGYTKYWEACASCLDNTGLVTRPYKITLEYYDIYGNKKKEIYRGFESTVLSHEYDHLNGVLHMDIAEELILMEKEERKLFRLEHGYEIISKKGDYEKYIEDNKKR